MSVIAELIVPLRYSQVALGIGALAVGVAIEEDCIPLRADLARAFFHAFHDSNHNARTICRPGSLAASTHQSID
jgi:hypothetical protein